MASMAVSVAAKAVMMMTGKRGSIWRMLVERLQPRHVRQPHVQHHDVGPQSFDLGDALQTGRGHGDIQRLRAEALFHGIENVRLVIHNKQSGHGFRS